MAYYCLKCMDERPGPGRCLVCGCKVLSEPELERIRAHARDLDDVFLKGEGSRPPLYPFVFEERRS